MGSRRVYNWLVLLNLTVIPSIFWGTLKSCVKFAQNLSWSIMKATQLFGQSGLWSRQILTFRIKPTFAWFVIAIAITFLINACNVGQTQAQPLKVGITSWAGFDIVLYAQSSEIFKQRGLNVELTRFENQQDSSRAVMRGELDAAFASFWDVMQTDPGNDKPVVLMTTNISAGSDGIVAKPEIQSVKDLRGKRVGAKLGTVNHLILLEALKAHQVVPSEVQILNYSNDVAAEKLVAGEIDAAVLWEPMLGETAKTIQGNVIHTTKQLDSLVIDTLMSSTSTIKVKKAELTQFLLAWFDVMHAVDTQPNQVFKAVGEQLGQSGDSFANDYAGLKKGDIALNQRMFQANGLSAAKTQIIQLLQADPRHGRLIRQDVEIEPNLVSAAIEAWKP